MITILIIDFVSVRSLLTRRWKREGRCGGSVVRHGTAVWGGVEGRGREAARDRRGRHGTARSVSSSSSEVAGSGAGAGLGKRRAGAVCCGVVWRARAERGEARRPACGGVRLRWSIEASTVQYSIARPQQKHPRKQAAARGPASASFGGREGVAYCKRPSARLRGQPRRCCLLPRLVWSRLVSSGLAAPTPGKTIRTSYPPVLTQKHSLQSLPPWVPPKQRYCTYATRKLSNTRPDCPRFHMRAFSAHQTRLFFAATLRDPPRPNRVHAIHHTHTDTPRHPHPPSIELQPQPPAAANPPVVPQTPNFPAAPAP